eukprot:scaffold9262_cov287-Chaetoceros_neogracile.AAC.6
MNSARKILGLLESRGDIAKCNIFLKARSRNSTPARMNATTSIRTFSRTDKRPLLPLMLFPLAVMTMYEHRTFCQGHENDNESRSDDNNQEQRYDEEEEKDSCPFCRFFLESPCSEAFQVWHECIKKSDKATDCMVPFQPLKDCMEVNGITMGEEESDESSEETH